VLSIRLGSYEYISYITRFGNYMVLISRNLPVFATWLDTSSSNLDGMFELSVFSGFGASEIFSATGVFFVTDLVGVFGKLGDC